MKKILLGLGALGITLGVIPMFAAFEAHVVNVTAQIENALQVSTNALDFGTVFPQEHLEKPLAVQLSSSFLAAPRVDDVNYFIRQKPKCGITNSAGTALVGPTATGHVIPTLDDPATTEVDESNGGTAYTIDCGPAPRQLVEGEIWGVLPSLCQYISKNGNEEDGTAVQNDGTTFSFHQPFTVSNSTVLWNDTVGRLTKLAQDTVDNWVIDLAVPCFGNFCAQDWLTFVRTQSGNPQMTQEQADAYTQPIGNEHKVFGCDLWIEVSGVSELVD